MLYLRRSSLVVLISATLVPASVAPAQTTLTYPPAPVPVDQVAAKMTVPEGFKVSLFAGEPDVVQPIAFTFDDRGRMWVAECLSYPHWTNDGTGHDRIIILEDTDGDGRHDSRKVFADNLANLSGLELGFGGVFICSLPELKFIPDRDGDDVPDGAAESLLDGWSMDCRHNVFNGLAWGPDGWLYGLNGILSTSKVGKPGATDAERTYFDCGVWRYHPTRRVFEPVAYGTTNPWGLDWDDYGEMFITNCVIKHLFHVVPGGHYERMFGSDPNPHVYGLMQSCADHIHWAGGHWTDSRGAVGAHSDAGGGHAHSGCSVYLGDNFPPEYRNNVFMCNIHGNRVNRDSLERQGSGYVAHHEPDFLFANDPWFRGLGVKYGPDGGLYVSDWCDTGECHNHQVVDATNGRIVKVMYEGSGDREQGTGTDGRARLPPSRFNLQKLSDTELVELQLHRNDWWIRHARRILQERADAGKLQPDTADRLRKLLAEDEDETRRLRALWALHAIGAAEDDDYVTAYDDESEYVRGWAVTLACDHLDKPREGNHHLTAPLIVFLLDATRDTSNWVKLKLAAAVQRIPDDDAHVIAAGLANGNLPPEEQSLPLMIWYGIESAHRRRVTGVEPPSKIPDALREAMTLRVPIVRRYAARYLVLNMNREGQTPEKTMDFLLAAMLRADLKPDAITDICSGMLEGLKGTRDMPKPPRWDVVYAKLAEAKEANLRQSAKELAVIFGDENVLQELRTTLQDADAKQDERRQALELLVEKRQANFLPALVALLDDASLRTDSLRGLAAYGDSSVAQAIVDRFAKFNDAEKADALQTLASRPAFALALLDAVEAGRIERRDVPSGIAVQLAALKNKTVDERLAKVWGSVRATSKQRLQQAERLKTVLSSEAVAKADPTHGRALFTKNCSACHTLFGEGGKIGPELTGSQRANVDYILENVLDPSAKVGRPYQVNVLELADGRVVQGVIADENDLAVTVQTQNERLTVPKADIENRQVTKLSIMPDGLFDKLSDQEIRDLMAYLASNVSAK